MSQSVFDSTANKLQREHTDEAIAARIAAPTRHSYVGDFVLGAVDGAITTFAIVSGVAGAELHGGVAIAFVLGLSNVLADGFSMAVSNFLKARADQQVVDQVRRMEEMHIEHIPEGEREEIRQIFAAKGFDGPTLDEIVRVITQDRRRWVNTMLTEEWGLQIDGPAPWKAGLVTFLAFLLAGMVPLLPLLLALHEGFSSRQVFAISAVFTGLTFFVTGMFRGRMVRQSMLVGGIETLLVGGAAAGLAYLVGAMLKGWIA